MITNSIAKSFMFFLIFTPVIKSIAKEPTAIEELIKNGDLKIIAVPSKYNINLTQKIHVSLYIINESQKNINFHLMGGKSKNFAVSNVIEGAYFAVEDGNPCLSTPDITSRIR